MFQWLKLTVFSKDRVQFPFKCNRKPQMLFFYPIDLPLSFYSHVSCKEEQKFESRPTMNDLNFFLILKLTCILPTRSHPTSQTSFRTVLKDQWNYAICAAWSRQNSRSLTVGIVTERSCCIWVRGSDSTLDREIFRFWCSHGLGVKKQPRILLIPFC